MTTLGTSNQRTLTSILFFYPVVISNEIVDCEMQDEKNVFVNSHLMLMVRWTRRKSQEEEEWKTLAVLDNSRSHHKTVKRIKVRRPSEKTTPKSYLVATCSDDHFVKLHNIKMLDAIKQ